jgi:hypothetical protein
MERGTDLTWPDGSPRGAFCDICRDWIGKGHRDSPVVFVGRARTVSGKEVRSYRNDTTGYVYTIMRGDGLSWAKTERAFIKALQKEG